MADKVYSATYSNVPVYECNIAGNHVMRRRADDWINATHILKVADYDKPTRTRILEREVQKGVHEKVQGGYGKYQGTWIPLQDGKVLAERNQVLEKMRAIFDFVPGDKTPPPAPKHATAASGKPRQARGAAAQRRSQVQMYAPQPEYDAIDVRMHDARPMTPDDVTVEDESVFDGYDNHPYSSRKRRRLMDDPQVIADNQHQLWADELLDYFILQGTSPDMPQGPAPQPPEGADLNRPIDDKGHTALHWAAAMGEIDVVKSLIRDGASIDIQSRTGETPLMRCVMFTNIYEKQNMERIASLLIRTVNMQEWTGSTVFHHIAQTTDSKKKYQCARYYMDCILNKMAEVLSPDQIERVLNEQDQNGDTAITIAARHGARKCVRSLIGRNAAVDVPNLVGETADQLIVQLNHRRQERTRQLSSSPFQAATDGSILGGAVQPPNGIPFDPLVPQSSLNGPSDESTVYRSEPALHLTAHIMPSLFAKAKQLASSIDAEIQEKDAELAEAERVVNMRRAELEQLQRQAEELRVKDLEQTAGGTQSDEELAVQLRSVESECLALLEAEQSRTLTSLLQTPQSPPPSVPADNTMDEETLQQLQLDYARQIISLREERMNLVRKVAENLALAGLGANQQQDYRRLIQGALGVGEDELEGLLPEIVEELEMGRGLEGVGV